MNKFFLLSGLIFMFSSCLETKNSFAEEGSSNHNNQSINTEHNLSQDKIVDVEYNASSRGYFFYVKINEQLIQKTNDRNLKNIDSEKCSKKNWEAILSLIETINIKTINKLKAPTEKRLFDGAPHAQLKITTAHHTYTTNGFDHGYPPEELKQLVTTILALTESIE